MRLQARPWRLARSLLKPGANMPATNAAVIDLSEYRRRRQQSSSPASSPALMWMPTVWGYWVPVWIAK